jgi:hypothetical protein
MIHCLRLGGGKAISEPISLGPSERKLRTPGRPSLANGGDRTRSSQCRLRFPRPVGDDKEHTHCLPTQGSRCFGLHTENEARISWRTSLIFAARLTAIERIVSCAS